MRKHFDTAIGPALSRLASSLSSALSLLSSALSSVRSIIPPQLRKITSLSAALIMVVLGLAVFFSGLSNPFLGDDQSQIVDNPIVHSVANAGQFFSGSTFSSPVGPPRLTGFYYRPLMTLTYSLLYTRFGADPMPFHLLQLALHIAGAFLVFVVFRYFFKPALALVLAIAFLLHPANSQAVYAIATMQEPLFFCFGMLAFWTLLRFQGRSRKYLLLTAACLLLALLAKETGLLFVGICLLYVVWFDRKRAYAFAGLLAAVVAAYLAMKTRAVGLAVNPHNAPIDELSLPGRLLTAPAIILFYLIALVFPWRLARAYYWVYPSISFTHVILPLLIVLPVASALIYIAILLRKHGFHRQFALFAFFGAWLVAGLLMHLQVIPLDFTASETWLYFPIVGVLGMIGAVADAFGPRISRAWAIVPAVIVITLYGARTAVRAADWSEINTLAYHDVKVSKEDYMSEYVIASDLFYRRHFGEAKRHAARSVSLYPNALAGNILGESLANLHDLAGAKAAFQAGLKHSDAYGLYANLAVLAVYDDNPGASREFIQQAIKKFPGSGKLWLGLALLEYKNHNLPAAKDAVKEALKYDPGSQYYYDEIMNEHVIDLTSGPSM